MLDEEEALLRLDKATWPDQAAPWREAAGEVLSQLEATCYAKYDQARSVTAMSWWLKLACHCKWERARLKQHQLHDAGPEVASSVARLVEQLSRL